MRAALLALGPLAACVAAPPPALVAAPLLPTARGVDVPGTGLEIGFGRALEGAEGPLARLYEIARAPCAGGGAILTAGGVEMHFPDGTFAGWRAGEATTGRLCAG